METRFYDLSSDKVYHENIETITLLANQSTEIAVGTIPAPPLSEAARIQEALYPKSESKEDRTHTVVIYTHLINQATGEVVFRSSNWPEPYKFIEFSEPEVKIKLGPSSKEDELVLELSSSKPVKGLFFTTIDDEEEEDNGGGVAEFDLTREAKWSDNAIDLFPGDVQRISVKNLRGRKVNMACMAFPQGRHIALDGEGDVVEARGRL